jgi:HSP20 family protein
MSSNEYKDIFRQMEREMQQLTDEVFRGFFDGSVREGKFWQPNVDVHESASSILIKVELTGVKAEDLSITLASDDRFLTIAGIRKEADADREGRLRCHQLEIYFGPFERKIAIPQHAPIDRDNIHASVRDGFLIITIPKRTSDNRDPKKIIVTNENGQSGETNDRS